LLARPAKLNPQNDNLLKAKGRRGQSVPPKSQQIPYFMIALSTQWLRPSSILTTTTPVLQG
jgi:hypothetical protein